MSARHVLLTVWDDAVHWSAGGTWTSPVVDLAFAARELIPSWNARTPGRSWLLVEARVHRPEGWTPWLTFARWAQDLPGDGGGIIRTSVDEQSVGGGEVRSDRFLADVGHCFDSWQVRLTGHAPAGQALPSVSLVAGCASHFAADVDGIDSEWVSEPVHPAGTEIPVPRRSQRRHLDTFVHWDRGGSTWCSPTSTTMLLEHWGVAPTPDESAWVGHETDPQVVHAVRQVYDEAFGGTGNWAFNTAYAATRGLRAYVTRLRDLAEAERFVRAGIPLVVAVTFGEGDLPGSGYVTSGHLLTVVGFTESGQVISNDPNSRLIADNEAARVVYPRREFERAWLGADGGLCYVMHPADVTLPPVAIAEEPNWG